MTTTNSTSGRSCKCTLMDIARSECFLSSQKRIHLAGKVNTYLTMFKTTKAKGLNYIDEILKAQRQPMPSIAYDCLLKHFATKCSGFQNQFATDARKLYQKIANLLWYISPHAEKLKECSCPIPQFFYPLLYFNDPEKGKHTVGRLSKNIVLEKIEAITTILEKSFTTRKSFGDLKFEIDKLIDKLTNNAFFSTQPQCSLTFSWIEFQMLLRCCLIRIAIIVLRHILYLVY